MAGNVVDFNDANFQSEVLDSDHPVLVDFWAPWCGPCKQLAPAIEELANDYSGKVTVGKLNTDESRQAAINYQISSIPTLIVFKGGQPVERITGLQPKGRIADVLNKHV